MGDRHVDSTSDDRTANNAVRHQYRVLNEDEKKRMLAVKDAGAALIRAINNARGGPNQFSVARYNDIAVERAEESVMWAVKAITA